MKFGTCDCCGKINREVITSFITGLETSACHECGGNTPEDYDEAGYISSEIANLLQKAETGEQFAHICALESRLVELTH